MKTCEQHKQAPWKTDRMEKKNPENKRKDERDLNPTKNYNVETIFMRVYGFVLSSPSYKFHRLRFPQLHIPRVPRKQQQQRWQNKNHSLTHSLSSPWKHVRFARIPESYRSCSTRPPYHEQESLQSQYIPLSEAGFLCSHRRPATQNQSLALHQEPFESTKHDQDNRRWWIAKRSNHTCLSSRNPSIAPVMKTTIKKMKKMMVMMVMMVTRRRKQQIRRRERSPLSLPIREEERWEEEPKTRKIPNPRWFLVHDFADVYQTKPWKRPYSMHVLLPHWHVFIDIYKHIYKHTYIHTYIHTYKYKVYMESGGEISSTRKHTHHPRDMK